MKDNIFFFHETKINQMLNHLVKRYGDGLLDELVHDVVSAHDSTINNAGLE